LFRGIAPDDGDPIARAAGGDETVGDPVDAPVERGEIDRRIAFSKRRRVRMPGRDPAQQIIEKVAFALAGNSIGSRGIQGTTRSS
jgi:hypothetical protein